MTTPEDSDSRQAREAGEADQAARLQRQIDERTERISALYDRWHVVGERRARVIAELGAPEQYEDLRKSLEEINQEDDRIGEQIERLDRELDALYEALRASRGQVDVSAPESAGDSHDPESRKLSLHRRLHEIADAQNAAVRRWNENPVEKRRPAFEEELQRLHDQFSEVLEELEHLSAD